MASGATHLFGDTLRSNDAMIGLALKSSFAFARSPYDWKQVRFEKPISFSTRGIPLCRPACSERDRSVDYRETVVGGLI